MAKVKIKVRKPVPLNFNSIKLKAIKRLPDILMGIGTVSGAGCVIFACKGTLNVNEPINDAKEEIAIIHDREYVNPNYSKDEKAKDLIAIYSKTGLKVLKLYSPSIIFGSLSLGSFFTAHNKMKKRNAALAVTCATVTNNFLEYKERVKERYGEDAEAEITHNIINKEKEVIELNKKGKEVKKKKKVKEPNGKTLDTGFGLWFDKNNPNFTNDLDSNVNFIRIHMAMLNKKLSRKKGNWLSYNDVKDEFGYERNNDEIGQIYGWKYDGTNDSLIDVGLSEKDGRFVDSVQKFLSGDPKYSKIFLAFNPKPLFNKE